MYKGKRWLLASVLLVLTILFIVWVNQVQCQEKYPIKPINVIVPSMAGSGTDLIARFVVDYLSKKWGVPMNVINKPGGNNIPANMELYNAAPSGYTMMADLPPSSSSLVMVKDLPFEIMDRTFIASVAIGRLCFVVPSSSSYKSLEDVIKEVKRDPENFTWASQGGVGGTYLGTRQLFRAIGVDILKTKPVMVKSAVEAATLVAGGNVKLAGGCSWSSVKGPVKANLARIVAITGKERNPVIPDVPTTAELGYPTVDRVIWNGFSGPPKLPSYILDIWEKGLQEVVKDAGFISRVTNIGDTPSYLNSRELREHVKKEMEELKEWKN